MTRWRIIGILLLCLILAGSVACNPFGGEEEASQQLVEVVRGDLIISVSGSGNIEVSNEVNLAFGVGGRIDKVYVEEGDSVGEGSVLAKLDTDALELALTQAQVAHGQAQLALTQAEVAVETAEYNLDKAENPFSKKEIRDAEDDVDDAEDELYYTKKMLRQAHQDNDEEAIREWEVEVYHAQLNLAMAEDKLDDMLSAADEDEIALRESQVEAAKQSLDQAQESLGLTQQSLEQAQKELNKATLTAPFDGVVASVDADEGDTVSTITRIIHLIDITSMELKVEVDEIDIPDVEPSQRAIIDVDALPDLPLEGVVTFISSLAKEEAGVVVYEVTISFDVRPDSRVKVGMSATADIVTAERSNVLLVPNRAIRQDSLGNPIVEVMVGKEAQERPVVIGISDGFDTEIVDGLNEGEVVVERRGR